MKRMFILFPIVLALIIASTTCVLAAGKPVLPGPPIPPIKGEWQTIVTRSCIQTNENGFGSGPQFQLITDGMPRVAQETGVLSLFGDGTGSWSGKSVQINYNGDTAGSYPVVGYTAECDIAYQEVSDGAVNFQFDNCISTFTAGLNGGTGAYGGYSHFTAHQARLSADGLTMVIWDLDPRVERVWTTIPSGTTSYNDRICSRAGTAIKFR